MNRRKHKHSCPEDIDVLRDGSDEIGRVELAMDDIGADRLTEFEPLIAKYLDPNFRNSRGAAIEVLVGAWGMEKYLPVAIEALRHDPVWDIRLSAASALGIYAEWFSGDGECRDMILRELAAVAVADDKMNWVAYQELVAALAPERDSAYMDKLEYAKNFDRDRDIDRALLGPYLPD